MKNFCFALCSALFYICANPALGSEVGMPQLDPEFWIAQIFWLIIIFASLYLIVWKIFLPKITYSIENRKSKLINDLDEAQKLKEKAEKKLNEYNKIIIDAKKEAQKIIADSNKKLNQDIENKKKEFTDEVDKELLNVEKEILDLKRNSILSINKVASEISTEIIKQIIDTDVNKSNVLAIVDDIIKKNINKHI